MLKLQLQNFGHLMQRADSLEKTQMLGKTEGKRSGWQRMRWLDSITNSTDMNLSMSSQSISSLQGIVKERGAWRAAIQRVEHGLSTEQRWIMMKKNFSCTYLTSVYLPWWSVGSNLLPILLSFLNSSSYAYFINIFYQSVSLFFFFFRVPFEEQRFLISMKFNYLIFTLYISWFVCCT